MDEIKREYYKNGNIRIVRYFNNNGKLHRKNGPAVISYLIDGEKNEERYFINGEMHRKDRPAIIYYVNNEENLKEYWINGKLHRIDGPAVIWYFENGRIDIKNYYINGILYNDMFLYSVAVGAY